MDGFFDHQRGKGRIYKYDITGGRYQEADYYATGSGGKDARSSLKKSFHHEGLSRDAAIDSAIEALMDAADEDRGTGGFDLARRIYPTRKLITAKGVEKVGDEEILASRERVLARLKAS